jgi:hypothetical protein
MVRGTQPEGTMVVLVARAAVTEDAVAVGVAFLGLGALA